MGAASSFPLEEYYCTAATATVSYPVETTDCFTLAAAAAAAASPNTELQHGGVWSVRCSLHSQLTVTTASEVGESDASTTPAVTTPLPTPTEDILFAYDSSCSSSSANCDGISEVPSVPSSCVSATSTPTASAAVPRVAHLPISSSETPQSHHDEDAGAVITPGLDVDAFNPRVYYSRAGDEGMLLQQQPQQLHATTTTHQRQSRLASVGVARKARQHKLRLCSEPTTTTSTTTTSTPTPTGAMSFPHNTSLLSLLQGK